MDGYERPWRGPESSRFLFRWEESIKNVSSHPEYMEACLPLIHNSGISVNPCGNADGSIFVPGLFTGSLGWEMLAIKASVLYLAYFFLYGCVM